jgi:DNA-binding IclR family transcriptional regulator
VAFEHLIRDIRETDVFDEDAVRLTRAQSAIICAASHDGAPLSSIAVPVVSGDHIVATLDMTFFSRSVPLESVRSHHHALIEAAGEIGARLAN